MNHVFLCHASEDRELAQAISGRLEQAGIRCWIAPRDVRPGRDYAQSIVEAIAAARLTVLIFSESSNRSPHVKRELERSVSHGVPILPVRVENVVPSPSLEYFISDSHWLDAMAPPLAQHLDAIADAVRLLLGSPAESPHPQLRPQQRAVVSSHAAAQRGSALRTPLVVGLLTLIALAGMVGLYLSLGGTPGFPSAVPSPIGSWSARPTAAPTSPAPAVPPASATPSATAAPVLTQVYPTHAISGAGRYVNSELGFACTLPEGWTRTRPEVGVGVVLVNGNVRMSCTGDVNTGGATLQGAFATTKRDLRDQGYEISYENLGEVTYVVSGKRGEQGFYEWGMVGSAQTRHVRWYFPMNRKVELDAPVTRSVKEFATVDLEG